MTAREIEEQWSDADRARNASGARRRPIRSRRRRRPWSIARVRGPRVIRPGAISAATLRESVPDLIGDAVSPMRVLFVCTGNTCRSVDGRGPGAAHRGRAQPRRSTSGAPARPRGTARPRPTARCSCASSTTSISRRTARGCSRASWSRATISSSRWARITSSASRRSAARGAPSCSPSYGSRGADGPPDRRSVRRRSRTVSRDVRRARSRDPPRLRPPRRGASTGRLVIAGPSRLVLLGNPVSHSLSPAFQNAALRSAGIPLTYEAHRGRGARPRPRARAARRGQRGGQHHHSAQGSGGRAVRAPVAAGRARGRGEHVLDRARRRDSSATTPTSAASRRS